MFPTVRKTTLAARLRVLVAEDHPVVLEGIARILQREHEVVAAVRDGQRALSEAKRIIPDVLVCDISMPGLNGFQVALALQGAKPEIPIVFLTMHRDPAFASEASRLGVAGYVLKSSGASELLAAVRDAARGERHYPPDLKIEPPPR